MNRQTDFVQRPRIAVWLVNLFISDGEAEFIQGDLLEELSDLASKSGTAFARRWYWRQTMTTIAHLIGAQFRTAPWIITAVVGGGFLLRWFVSWWSNPAITGAVDAILYRLGYYNDPHAYIFWLTNSMLIARLVLNAFVGASVAIAAKRREMAATMTLALVGDVLAVYAALLTVSKTGDYGVLSTLPDTFLASIVIVVTGAIVRTRRSASPPTAA